MHTARSVVYKGCRVKFGTTQNARLTPHFDFVKLVNCTVL